MDSASTSASAVTAPAPLDDIDRRIVDALQRQGRMTFDELAGQVQLSASAVLRRVRRLEESGVIVGYSAIVPPQRLGLTVIALIELRLEPGPAAADALARALQDWPEVVECLRLGCDPSRYQLRVVSADLAQHGRFMTERLQMLPGLRDCHARFVLEQLRTGRSGPAA